MAEVLAAPAPAEIRAELEELVLADILGPSHPYEELSGSVNLRDHYLVGALAPRDAVTDPGHQEGAPSDGEDDVDADPADGAAPAGPNLVQSSFGMSFSVAADVTELTVMAGWGRYTREDGDLDAEGKPEKVWRREPAGGPPTTVVLREGPLEPVRPDRAQSAVVLHGEARRRDDRWVVTLFLVNEQAMPDRYKAQAWLFQAELTVEGPSRRPVFLGRVSSVDDTASTGDVDERDLDMLYRDHVEFAVGHGVAVHAEPSPSDPERAIRLSTTVVPEYEVPAPAHPPQRRFPPSKR